MSEWISIKDERPEPLRRVLVALDSCVVVIAESHADNWFCGDNPELFENAEAAHWMPLPKAPEVKE